MTLLFVDSDGAQVKLRKECLLVCRDNHDPLETPLSIIDRVVVVGNVHLTLPAMDRLLKESIPVSFLSRRGWFRGRLCGHTHKNVFLRLKQYQRYREDGFALTLSRHIIWSKAHNCRDFLMKHQRTHCDTDLTHEAASIKLQLPLIWNAPNIAAILGHEGTLAHNYFAAMGKMIRHEGFAMNGRTRRPPRDRVNALLSLGYTLLYNEAVSAVESIGFDPHLGFLHQPEYGRASLACDLMEEFRFLIDECVISVVNRGQLDPGQFVEDSGGWFLNQVGRRIFYEAYDNKLRTEVQLRQCES